MQNLFRILVVVSALLLVVGWFLPHYEYMWSTDDELRLLRYNYWGAKLPNIPWLYWGELFVWLVTFTGLFFYKTWARSALVFIFFSSLGLSMFTGLSVASPTSNFIGTIFFTAIGVNFSIIYLTSIANKFEKHT